MGKQLSPWLEREARRLVGRGHTLREIGSMVERSRHAVSNVLTRESVARGATAWAPSRMAPTSVDVTPSTSWSDARNARAAAESPLSKDSITNR